MRLRRATLDPKTLRRNIRYSEVTYGVSPTAADIIDLTGGTTPPVAGRQAVSSRSNRPAAPGWFPRPSGRCGAWPGTLPRPAGPGALGPHVRRAPPVFPSSFHCGGTTPRTPACGYAAKPGVFDGLRPPSRTGFTAGERPPPPRMRLRRKTRPGLGLRGRTSLTRAALPRKRPVDPTRLSYRRRCWDWSN